MAEGDVVVTTVASLTSQKGHEYLLQAARDLVGRHPTVRFLLVGDGGLGSELANQITALRLEGHVRLLGRRIDVPEIMAASDIFVLPSLWEGLPLVLVEAGMASLPVIASRVDGIPEVVEDGRSGILVPPGDPCALAVALRALIEDAALRAQMGKEGKAIALERFSMERVASVVAGLYHQLLTRKIKKK